MACGVCFIYYFVIRLVAYFAILGFLVIVAFVALKCLGEWRERHPEEEGENSHLITQCDFSRIGTTNYGACQEDPESGNCNNSNSSSSSKCSTLYDAKICIICYDVQRNCFFVPCGHCATCFVCAQRIFYEENRNCPVCRRYIGKIRRLIDS